ncbi:MAG: DUF1640 domain-containing protein [Magnetococcales bacterium]|nr:DUF1640 domain-containing protein [Magnetococcales bacterium]
MTVIAFDTLAFVEELKASGFDDAQAKGMVGALKKVQDAQMQELSTKADLRELEYRIIIRLGGLMIAGFGILAAIVKMH